MDLWRREPFRIFFPFGVVLGWIGIGHWVLYAIGWTSTFSCFFHGIVQLQAFLMAFAVGFLLTALPRRTQSAPPAWIEIAVLAALLSTTTFAAMAEQWVMAEAAYAGVFIVLLQFALRRFLRSSGRRPPAAFVLIPIGILHGLGGATLIALAEAFKTPPWTYQLGRLFVEQGVFLCFAVGIGGLILPLMGGNPPPADLGSAPREGWRALGYAGAGLLIFASFLLEQLGAIRGGPMLRAVIVTGGFGLGGQAWHPPGKPGLHRRLAWAAVWCMPAGLVVSAVWPDYRVAALHILFIGGFALMAFAVATHVSFSHLPELEPLALRNPPVIKLLAITFTLALAARLAADMSNSYFDHLGWAAALWLIGSAAWLAFLGPKLLRLS